jgi:alpha-L-fucosidase
LIEIAAKGGSLLLGVGPSADGTFSEIQVSRLKEIGQWMKENGEAIYSTRAVNEYRDGETFFTKAKGDLSYALVRLAEDKSVPAFITWSGHSPKKGSKIKLLSTGESVKWKADNNVVKLFLPRSFIKNNKSYAALAFSFQE